MPDLWRYEDFVQDALKRVPQVSCEELYQRLEGRPVVLDVREMDEMDNGYVPGAVQLARGLVEKHAHDVIPDSDQTVYVCCSTGKRSALVADVLQKMGFGQVFNLEGGMARWEELHLPVTGARGAAESNGAGKDWQTVRDAFSIVQRQVPVLGAGNRRLVYLDHAASTQAPEPVLAAYHEFMSSDYANVHRGVHILSRQATERFEATYETVARFLGGNLETGCVCFTTNTTQAIDLAAHTLADQPGVVVTSEMEHHSNDLPHRRRGPVLHMRVDEEGHLDLDHLEHLLRGQRVKLVAVAAASNVSGIVNPIDTICRLAHAHGARVLLDAAQILARRVLDVRPPEDPAHIDFIAAAGHKAYAPFGSAFLYGPRDLLDAAPPYLPGGGTAAWVEPQKAEFLLAPDRHQGGTPNIGGVFAMARSLTFLQEIGMERVEAHERRLLQMLMDGLRSIEDVIIYGDPDPSRRLGVVSFNVCGLQDMLTAAILSEEGAIAVRNGRFCAQRYTERLLEIGHPVAEERPEGAVRASLGLYNNERDVERLLDFVERIRNRKWVGDYEMHGGGQMSARFAGRCADRWMTARDPNAKTAAATEH